MQRGYARDAREEKLLLEAGLTHREIYVEGRGDESFECINMRAGEWLVCVNGLRALGDSRRQIVPRVRQIHDQGAAIYDPRSGMRSDRNGVEMLDAAIARAAGERRIGTADEARERQALSVKARIKGRMDQRMALEIWRRPDLTTNEKIDLMRGWSKRTAYEKLGKTGIRPGRRVKED